MPRKVFRVLMIPCELYHILTFEIYRAISRRIDENDKNARELVNWYVKNVGISGQSLAEKLNRKEAAAQLG